MDSEDSLINEDGYDFLECAICISTMDDIVSLFSIANKEGDKACTHSFCRACLLPYFKKIVSKNEKLECPVCRESFDGFINNKIAKKIVETSKKYSSTTRMLEKEIQALKQEHMHYREDVEKNNVDKGELEEKLAEHQNNIEHLEAEREKLAKEAFDTNERFRYYQEQQQQEQQQQKESLRQYLQQVKDLQINNARLSESLSTQANSTRIAEEKNVQLSTQTRDLSSHVHSLEDNIRSMKLERDKMSAMAKDFENKSRLKEKQIEQLYQTIEDLKLNAEQERHNYQSSIEVYSKGRDKINELEGALTCVKVEQSKKEVEVEQLRRKNRQLEKESEDLRSRLNNTKSDSYLDMLKMSTVTSFFSKQVLSDFIIPYKDISVYERRGNNKNSTIIRASYRSESCVLKLINYTKPSMSLPYYSQNQDFQGFRESMILSKLRHPNIVHTDYITKDDNGRYYSVISPFVPFDLEYVSNNHKSKKTTIPMNDVKFIAYQLVSAVHYLHSQDLVHRDLKPTSLLLFDDYQMRLCSFHMCCSILTSSSSSIGLTIPSTFNNYSAPEIVMSSGITQKRLDWKAIDIWSIGVILAELYFGKELFTLSSGNNNTVGATGIVITNNGNNSISNISDGRMHLLKQMISYKECAPEDPQYFTSQNIGLYFQARQSIFSDRLLNNNNNNNGHNHSLVIDLLSKMLKFDPNARITAGNVLNHPFFTKEPFYNPITVYDDIASSLTDRNIKDFVKDKCNGII